MKDGRLIEGIFKGDTINTPSMLAVEDYLDTLAWAERIGGLPALHARADANAKAIYDWVGRTPWIAPLAVDPATYSNTGVCLVIADPDVLARGDAAVRPSPPASSSASTARACPRYRRLPRRSGRPADLVRRHGRDGRSGGADALARLGVRGREGGSDPGGVRQRIVST